MNSAQAIRTLGVVLVAVGATTVGSIVVRQRGVDQTEGFRLATSGIVIGTVLLVAAGVRKRGHSVDEAYRLGYDLGYEEGFRRGHSEGRSHARPSLVRTGTDGQEVLSVVPPVIPTQASRHRKG